jgi:4-amino-4-deoxy-L-arabinose transferase-like glycosyltransferase
VALWLVVGVAVILRFYHLGEPYLWNDEIYSVLNGLKPLHAILDAAFHNSDNSPYFFLLLKGVTRLGISDFALRAPFALAGAATVYLLHRLFSARLGEAAALAAAGYLAVSPYHIWASREIRPYVLILLLFVCSLHLLVASLRPQARFRLWPLAFANAGLIALHYLCLLLVAAQGLVVAVFAACDIPKRRRQAVWFAVVSVLGALPVLPFLASFVGRKDAALQAASWLPAAQRIGLALAQVASPTGTAAGLALFLPVAAVGTWRLFRRDARFAAILTALTALVVAGVLAMRSGRAIWPVYFLLLLAPAALLFGAATMTPRRFAGPACAGIAALVLLAGTFFFTRHQDDFYGDVNGYAAGVYHITSYKKVARELPALIAPTEITTVYESLVQEGVNWYLNQFTAPNPLIQQGLPPGGAQAHFNFLTVGNDFAQLGRDEASLFARLGQPVRVVKNRDFSLYTFSFLRQGTLQVERTPFYAVLGAAPETLLRQAYSLRGLTIYPAWGCGVVATARNHPGSLEYVLEDRTGLAAQTIQVWFRYANDAAGNVLRCAYAFDDEPAVPLMESVGKDPRSAFAATLHRDKPYKRLTLRFTLLAATDEDRPNMAILRTLQLRETRVSVCAPDQESDCALWLYTSTLPQGFLDTALPGQHTLAETDLAETPGGAAGWTSLRAADAARPGRLTVKLDAARPGLVFYPRLCGPNASLQVSRQESDGSFRQVFALRSPPADCTPVGMQCPIDIGPTGKDGALLRFEFFGKGAQIDRRGENVLFQLDK